MSKTLHVIIGTSGWQYADWNGLFYPANIKGKDQLGYFAKHFSSVEINNTFYHVPRLSTVENWVASVPSDFRFVIKLNRFLTHTKRLTSDYQFTERLQEFLDLLKPLGDKLVAVLVQLPPSMQVANSRLEYLAKQVRKVEKRLEMKLPVALEARHASWFNDKTFAIMRQHNIANVINDSLNRWPSSQEVTADFAYIRFHGNKQLYRSSYSRDEFNNDYNGVAVQNAKTLQQIFKQQN